MNAPTTILFFGDSWENDPGARFGLPAGSSLPGGLISFSGRNRQSLIGGYNAASKTGPVIPSIRIANASGLQLENSSVKVGRQVDFRVGSIFLNGKVFVAGDQQPGIITGFDSSKFFVSAASVDGGILMRENIRRSDGLVIFPVGIRSNSYSPAAIQTKTDAGDDYFVSVMEGVQSNVGSGQDLKNESVNRTWEVGKRLRPGSDEIELFLQHPLDQEGGQFAATRDQAYVSRYNGARWDEGFPQVTPSVGYLTSGTTIKTSGVNRRNFKGQVANGTYFTKFTGLRNDSLLHTRLLFAARRKNSRNVHVFWQTKPELGVKYFVVERRFIDETEFSSRDTVYSTAVNGRSYTYLEYELDDANNFRGISFYRLKVVGYDGSYYYSIVVAVNGVGLYPVILWPNPTPDRFFLIINSPTARSVVIFNALGQKMWSRKIDTNNQTYIEVKGHQLNPGVYFVSIFNADGKIFQTEKLVIIGK